MQTKAGLLKSVTRDVTSCMQNEVGGKKESIERILKLSMCLPM